MTIVEFLQKTIDGKLSVDEQKDYLLKHPFPNPAELADTVQYLYAQMPEVPKLSDAIDVCGTGGSGLAKINASTISAFVIAGAGVPVAKHGNNTASGKFGSFDLLNALNVPINLDNNQLQLRFRELNLAFLYAKSFHPVMRFFAPVRSQLTKPTFFNILGPLLSPVNAQKQLIGTPKIEYARLIAETAKALKKERVIVVVGSDGLDEVTLTGKTHVVELNNGKIKEYDISPADFGIKPAQDFTEISSLQTTDNIKIARHILAGREKTRHNDLVLVNSAMALFLAGKAHSLKDGYKLAKTVLDSGKAQAIFERYCMPDVLNRIIAGDSKRDFSIDSNLAGSTQKYSGGLIAEIKRSSPSEGSINRDINIVEQAKLYEQAGAAAISVLCESTNFGGSFDDLKTVRASVGLPILCKDFIVSRAHIDKAKSCGADIILLIAGALSSDQLKDLYTYASNQKLQILVEVHTAEELQKALVLKPEIIGVNSRNLHDFSLHPQLFEELKNQIPDGTIKIAESGIRHFKNIPSGYDGILVGTVLMKYPFPNLKIKELTGRPLLKLCGIRSMEAAKLCEELGVDMIGLNFVPRSRRRVDMALAKQITGSCKRTITVGVFENQSAEEVNQLARESGVQAVQLSGQETDLDKYQLPIIKTLRTNENPPAEAFMTILDSAVAGSGQQIKQDQIAQNQPSLIAGGVDEKRAEQLIKTKNPLGIDTASGIETNGRVDLTKIKNFYKLISQTKY